jgi:hypothetical protein
MGEVKVKGDNEVGVVDFVSLFCESVAGDEGGDDIGVDSVVENEDVEFASCGIF